MNLQRRFNGVAFEHLAQVLRRLLRVLWLLKFERGGPDFRPGKRAVRSTKRIS